MRIFHADGFCDGELKAVNDCYGQGLPTVQFECSKCGIHLGSLPDTIVPDITKTDLEPGIASSSMFQE